ncbi:MAG: FxLYD domain-containing protein [Muribaculaceae bacterium]|nr:FxLYD domain-containing protein [Muribaculaceae bacterium]
MKKISLIAALLIAALPLIGQRTTRRSLAVADTAASETAASDARKLDTIAAPAPHTVDVNGYDKPLRSRRETFFVTNNSDKDVRAIALTITYYDTKNRMLHSASHHVDTDIPARQTRQLSLSSWDKQFAFFYQRSAVPQRATQATPFDVKISIDTLFVDR